MSFQNASKYYVALAFYVSPESRDTWIHMKKSAIEKTMRTCGIQHLTILSDVKHIKTLYYHTRNDHSSLKPTHLIENCLYLLFKKNLKLK